MNDEAPHVVMIPIDDLHPFPGHPFRVMMDADMDKLVESVRANGVLVPGVVRPRLQGGYDIISGHRRREASKLAGRTTMPVVIRENLDDNAATIAMVEVNLKTRERLLPSERARAYRMMRDALMAQGGESPQSDDDSSKTKDRIAKHFGESASKVMRTIRLTCLNQPLLDMVDGGKLKLGLAIQISYLDTEVQCWITDYHSEHGAWPTSAQIKELRALFEHGELTQDAFLSVMGQTREQQMEQQTEQQSAPQEEQKTPTEPSAAEPATPQDDFIIRIRDEHFPSLTIDDVKEKVIELIEQYLHRRRCEM